MKKVSIGLAVLFLMLSAAFSATAQKRREAIKPLRVEVAAGSFGKIEAFSEGRGVWLNWQMNRETNNLGFNVRRGGEAVNRGLIPGAYLELGATDSANRTYSYFDAAGDLNSTYTIGTFNLNGAKGVSAPIRAQKIDDLSKVAGVSLKYLKASAKDARPNTVASESVIPADARAEIARDAPQTDAANQAWVAAQPGAKIGVRQEGVYRVTRAQLQSGGFDVNASPALWQLYVGGVEQSIIVGGNGDYIEFYGRGIDTSEAGTQIYYLVVGAANGKRIAESLRRPEVTNRIPIGTFLQTTTQKERLNYSANVLNGDEENFFGSVITNSGANVSLFLTGVNFSAATAALEVSLQGLTTVSHQTRIVLNGHELGLLDGTERDSATARFVIPTAFLLEGSNNLQFTALLGSGDISFFDRVKLTLSRRYRAEQNTLSFYTTDPRVTYAENFTSANIRVFDISNVNSPQLVTGLPVEANAGAFRVYLPSNRRARSAEESAVRGFSYFIAEDSAVLPAATVTPNVPSTLKTTLHNADLIIITYKNWAAQANDWANYRRAQGMSVEVADIEDIFDEFSFGVYDSLAIRRFLQYSTGSWQTAPHYALLIGDATYDTKNYFGAGYNSFIPTRLADTVYTEVGSDDALADFNDDGLAEIAIGRIPAKSGAYVTQQLNKVTAFEQTIAQQNGISRGALFASDVPNGYDFAALSERVRQQLPQSVPSISVNKLDANSNDNLLAEMNGSKYIVNYSGHGSVADWAGDSSFFGRTRASQLGNSNLSIFTMLTCLNGFFISPNQSSSGDGLAEVLLNTQNGAVASWASTGLTTPDVQEIMATRFFQQIGAGNITRLGDLVNDAKTEINFGRDVRLSWVLLGDPTLKVR